MLLLELHREKDASTSHKGHGTPLALETNFTTLGKES